MTVPSATSFDIRDIPFSRRGSWLDISPVVGLHKVCEKLHLVSHQTGMHAIFVFEPLQHGLPVEAIVEATPTTLRWSTPSGVIEAVFESDSVLRVRGRAAELRLADATPELTPFTGTYLYTDPIDGAPVFTSYETGRRYRVTAVSGSLAITGAEALGAGERAVCTSGPEWEIAIEEFDAARAPYRQAQSFEVITVGVAAEFDHYVDSIASWRSERTPGVSTACYVLWSATVAPSGFLARESIFMSKHWMDKVWSWDHCFNALALAPGLQEEAIDQFRVVFDFQDATGALPDSITHSEVLYNFVKPPIHGWAFRKLRATLELPIEERTLNDIYDSLVRWTRFWLDSRRVPGHVLPHYQHGNDSGWDNSTTFDHDRVIEAPDLAAFLLVQLDVLAELAAELGRNDETDEWRREADVMQGALLELWDGDVFVAKAATSGRLSKTTSLLNTMPIVAARHLPDSIIEKLSGRISRHVTEFGPATQLVDSEEYEPDGYWRGPIWAPSTAIIEDGLRQAGQVRLADLISERFRGLCERSGFAENFDALTGEGLRDRAYTWTASCYLTFAREAEERTRFRCSQ
ncbi:MULTISPECIES: amylo-alpha-1,6-glucosidase [Cryobacterium]|uniref:Glycogen debranching protein n=1 Tax=Cryobacterium zongtaii TaxID=1259217 RepID=A0A2S3ZDJ0_9MICO|nr:MULTISPECIES: glycogen debranching protein [Cryobacterium]POH64390.1 glycogen debranching protein [Cryobacterium zongtaii]POH67813.1 glycogen debranching protein [Cryobacterium zongtaii]TFC47813.1 glycogen debranching protein [Cryobacterium sp. TMN-39-2]